MMWTSCTLFYLKAYRHIVTPSNIGLIVHNNMIVAVQRMLVSLIDNTDSVHNLSSSHTIFAAL